MVRCQSLPLGTVQPRGWLRQQLRDDLDGGFAGCLDALSEHAATDLFAHRIGASQSQIAWWDSETRGNWLWGYVMMAYLADHPTHKSRVDGLIEALLATQDAGGYIGIYSPEWRYRHPPGENGELWAQGRALLTLLAYHELTGRPDVLAAVECAARLTMSQYGPQRRYFDAGEYANEGITGLTHGLCYVDVAAWLYQLTGDVAYRDFGVWLYDDFCSMRTPFPNDDMAVDNLSNEHRPFGGHAVHTAEHLRVLLWAAAVTGRDDLQAAAGRALAKLRLYMLPGGALIGDESIHGFPRPDIGYEYCTTTELLFSLMTGHGLSGDSWYGDAVETLAFNAAQAARLPDGKAVAYLATDTSLSATAARLDSYAFLLGAAGRFKYSPTHEDVACCCVPNAVRLLPHYISGMWRRAEDGLVAAVYGACAVDTEEKGVRVHIEEETNYPFSDEIRLTITPGAPVEFAVHLRQPGWVQAMHVEGEGAELERADGYVRVQKAWERGDTIRVRMSNVVRSVPYLTGEHSIFYGPLQFVLPIAHVERPIKSYPVAGFHDYDVLPERPADAYEPLILDGSKTHVRLAVQRLSTDDPLQPWYESPIALTVGDKRLLPIGCTVLRRADFPVLEQDDVVEQEETHGRAV